MSKIKVKGFKVKQDNNRFSQDTYVLGPVNIEDGNATGSVKTIGVSQNYTLGEYAFAEGFQTQALGANSHTEGRSTTTQVGGIAAHAEGNATVASGANSHAEGDSTTASRTGSHAEGKDTVASGYYSHAEGRDTTASGETAHAQNRGTIAASDNQTTLGKYNIEDSNNEYAIIIGNGENNNNRSNALAIDWNGNIITNGQLINQQGDFIYNNNLKNLIDGSAEGSLMGIYTGFAHYCKRIGEYIEYATKTIDLSNLISQDLYNKVVKVEIGSNSSGISRDYENDSRIFGECEFSINNNILTFQYPAGEDPDPHSGWIRSGVYVWITTYGETSGKYSVALGFKTKTSGECAFAEGFNTQALGNGSHAEGGAIYESVVKELYITGQSGQIGYTLTDSNSEAIYLPDNIRVGAKMRLLDENNNFQPSDEYEEITQISLDRQTIYTSNTTTQYDHKAIQIESSVESKTIASGNASHAEGFYTSATGFASHAEGSVYITEDEDYSYYEVFSYSLTAVQNSPNTYLSSEVLSDQIQPGYIISYKNDNSNITSYIVNISNDRLTIVTADDLGDLYHKKCIIRCSSLAYGRSSHSEGSSVAIGDYSHAEGIFACSESYGSHAEGVDSLASGEVSHAEGRGTIASGKTSHAQNSGTIAASDNQTVLGKYNIEDSNDEYAVIIGNGTYDNARSNALTVSWYGDTKTLGNISSNNVYAGATQGSGSAHVEIGNSGIEIYHDTPYIDFHFGNSTADYTSRIIEEASGQLTLKGSYFIAPNIKATGNFQGNLTGNATTASYLQGFSSRNTIANWGNQNGTVLSCYGTPNNGGWVLREYNSAMNMIIDGHYYQNEGNNLVLDTSNYVNYVSQVRDAGNGTATKFQYSGSGMNYADYSWLAAWDGYTIRGVSKTQFAQASHTHSVCAIRKMTYTGSSALPNNSATIINPSVPVVSTYIPVGFVSISSNLDVDGFGMNGNISVFNNTAFIYLTNRTGASATPSVTGYVLYIQNSFLNQS